MNRYMEEANKLAEKNVITNEGGPFGAVVVKNGEIVSRGNNRVVKNNDPTAHAEIVAIREACLRLNAFSLEGCELYTSCYPCPMCLSAIIWSNIKVVYYGNTKEDAQKIGFKDDMIYKHIENLANSQSDNDTLRLIPLDREETIKTFTKYKENVNNLTVY